MYPSRTAHYAAPGENLPPQGIVVIVAENLAAIVKFLYMFTKSYIVKHLSIFVFVTLYLFPLKY